MLWGFFFPWDGIKKVHMIWRPKERLIFCFLTHLFCLKIAYRKEKPKTQGWKFSLLLGRSCSGCSISLGFVVEGSLSLGRFFCLVWLRDVAPITVSFPYNKISISLFTAPLILKILIGRLGWAYYTCQVPVCAFHKKVRMWVIWDCGEKMCSFSLHSQIDSEHKRSCKAAHSKHEKRPKKT